VVYQAQGKYAEAEELYIQALNIREKELGTDDPKVAAVCRNIANLYKQIGKEDQAERLEARARRIRSNQ
jgi:tetratricopeptide (TPR) repeat protein